MYKFLLLPVICSLFPFNLFGQDLTFRVKIVDYTTGLKSKTGFVNVYSNNVFESKHAVDTNGRVSLKLSNVQWYKIEACDSGKVCRYVLVHLNQEESDMFMGESISGGCEISLFPEEKDKDYQYVLNNPITLFTYSADFPELIYDEKKAKNMVDRVSEIMKKEESSDKK